ncbi:unnamed protein product [Camellia sinensis]
MRVARHHRKEHPSPTSNNNTSHTADSWNECVQPFAPEKHVCGRPLGLRFDKKTGDLYIADAYFGLQVVGPNGGLAILFKQKSSSVFLISYLTDFCYRLMMLAWIQ